jgi:hypothetical protein
VTELLRLGEQLVKALLDVVTNAIDQRVLRLLVVEVGGRSYTRVAALTWLAQMSSTHHTAQTQCRREGPPTTFVVLVVLIDVA